MAEPIYKVATGSVGPQGEQIFDAFEGSRKIELPEFQQRGLNMDQLTLGTAPTGFQSQFQPIKLDAGDTIPAETLEENTTSMDVLAELKKNIESRRLANEQVATQMTPSENEQNLQRELLGLNQLQEQRIQEVQERPLDGTVLTSGLQSEIQNIAQGNTRESLVTMRRIGQITQQLTLEVAQRQARFEVEKFKAEQLGSEFDDFTKLFDIQQEMVKAQEVRESRLTDNQRNTLETIVGNFLGLSFDQLDPVNQQQITQLANQLGIPTKSIANRMQIEKNELELSNMEKLAEIRKLNTSSSTSGELSPITQAVISNPSLFDDLTSTLRGQVIGQLQAAGYDTSNLGLKGLSDTAIKEISQTQKALEDLSLLKTKVQENIEFIGPISGLQKLNPWSKARQIQSDIDRVRQTVGKALEGGVLRKEDEEKYKKILATLTDTPETAIYKIDSLVSSIQRDMDNYKVLQQSSGKSLNVTSSLTKAGTIANNEDLRKKYNY